MVKDTGFLGEPKNLRNKSLAAQWVKCYFWGNPMMVQCETALKGIREDSTLGASELAHRAAQCLILFSQTLKNPSPSNLKRDLLGFMHRLISCQPAIAPPLDLANAVLMRIEGEKDVDEIKDGHGGENPAEGGTSSVCNGL